MHEEQSSDSANGSHPAHLGYEIGKTDSATTEALTRLLEYMRRLRRTGAETRGWTRHTLENLDEKLLALDHLESHQSREVILADLVAWETHILQIIRHYMQEASDTINRVKTLNPPLTTNQLRPFIQAVEDDRTDTIAALDPLTKALERLAVFKQRGAARSPKNAA